MPITHERLYNLLRAGEYAYTHAQRVEKQARFALEEVRAGRLSAQAALEQLVSLSILAIPDAQLILALERNNYNHTKHRNKNAAERARRYRERLRAEGRAEAIAELSPETTWGDDQGVLPVLPSQPQPREDATLRALWDQNAGAGVKPPDTCEGEPHVP